MQSQAVHETQELPRVRAYREPSYVGFPILLPLERGRQRGDSVPAQPHRRPQRAQTSLTRPLDWASDDSVMWNQSPTRQRTAVQWVRWVQLGE